MVFKVEVLVFNEIEIIIDFSQSENIKIAKNDNLVVNTKVAPFSKHLICRVELKKNWLLKSNIKIKKNPPSLID